MGWRWDNMWVCRSNNSFAIGKQTVMNHHPFVKLTYFLIKWSNNEFVYVFWMSRFDAIELMKENTLTSKKFTLISTYAQIEIVKTTQIILQKAPAHWKIITEQIVNCSHQHVVHKMSRYQTVVSRIVWF